MNWYCDVTAFQVPKQDVVFLRIENSAYGILPGIMVGYEDGKVVRWSKEQKRLIAAKIDGEFVVEYAEKDGKLVEVEREIGRGEGDLPAGYERLVPQYIRPRIVER